MLREMTPLCALARKHETDKGGRHYRYGGVVGDTCHEYTPVYWDLFSEQRLRVRRLLEIGVHAGSSLRMWEEFFPNAAIVGFDVSRACLFRTGRITTFEADQNSGPSLDRALAQAGSGSSSKFDIIIDDGSHEIAHQIFSLGHLLPYLADGGAYVVEDLHIDCQPEIVGNMVPPGFKWEAIPAPGGLGKAHCPCSKCGGKGPEQLLIIRHA